MKIRWNPFAIKADATPHADSRYEFKAAAGGVVDLLIYGRIWPTSYDDTMVGADKIARDLASVPQATAINVRINSGGGDMFGGNAIYNTLKNHAAPVTVYIDGLAASAASIIAMAGDTVIMPRNALMMIHNPSVDVEGDAAALESTAEALRKITTAFATAYQDKTGLDEAVVLDMMTAETWLTPAEAVEKGFADKIDDRTAVSVSAEGSSLTVNGLALEAKGFKNVPQALLASATHIPTPKPGQEDTMKIKELFAALRRRFGADKNPTVNAELDKIEGQIADDATAEEVATRIAATFQGALDAAQALTAPLVTAGIADADAVKALLTQAEAGKAYRADLITKVLAEGVRAKGDKFDGDRYQRLLDASNLDDIKALHAEFEEEAKARLGSGGRQTQASDPNAKAEGAGDKDIEAEAKPEAVEAYLKRTARA